MNTQTQQTLDERLELEIDGEYDLMLAAKTDEESKSHFLEMCRLIHRRSPTQVQKMEIERRLAIRQAKV